MSRHRFHGDPERFAVLADFVADRYWRTIAFVADVAGGQGMLTRILTKKYHYDCEVVDPRVHVLKGVKSQAREFDAKLAPYYDRQKKCACKAHRAFVMPQYRCRRTCPFSGRLRPEPLRFFLPPPGLAAADGPSLGCCGAQTAVL